MHSTSGQTRSCWLDSTTQPVFPPLQSDAKVDVCVVGAGIAGLSVAYQLVASGRQVLVVDNGPVGSGESGRTTAHLMTAFDDRYVEVADMHGAEVARVVAESHAAAIDFIERVSQQEGIDCDFRRVDGYLFLSPGESVELLDRELAAAHQAGLADVRRVERPIGPTADLGPALLFPRQGEIEPLKYLAGLAEAIVRRGGRICCGTHITGVAEESGSVELKTADGLIVTAAAAVVASNTPFNDMVAMHTKQSAYRTFVVGLPVARGAVPRAQYWDSGDPYHYVRIAGSLDETRDLLIVGGEDHKTGQADDADERFARLEAWTRERFPVEGAVVQRWSGQVMEPNDALGFIGRNPGEKNVYIVTGDSGNGMTHGTIAGMLITDLICDRPNPWAEAYDPSRKQLHSAGEFAKENLNVAGQYLDWLTPGSAGGIEQIAAGSGAVIRDGLKKIAIYRDLDGSVTALDATCPHLGCIVAWNSTEKSWDCPCHGSRFACDGSVLHGPAVSGLSRASTEDLG